MAVLSTTPANLATTVVRNVALQATFDVDLDSRTVTDLTVLLVKSSDRSVVSGIVDYIPGTRSITFQLATLLDANTEYTWILIGRTQGILAMDGSAALSSNYQIIFTTGAGFDQSIPLAPAPAVAGDITPFSGGQGIYEVISGRTGEPITHVVTTAGQVGLSGQIVPSPFDTSVYLASSGFLEPDPIQVTATYPTDGSTFLLAADIGPMVITFSETPVIDGLTNGGVNVLLENLLQLDMPQPSWTVSVVGSTLVVTPSVWHTGGRYTITVSSSVGNGRTGGTLGKDYVFSFTTKPDLYFTTVKMVRINLGAAISEMTDEDIQLLIYENSKWAVENALTGFDISNPPVYVKDFVLCKTKLDSMNIALMGTEIPVREKMGDTEFEYGGNMTDRFKAKMAEMYTCVRLTAQLILTGGVRGTMTTAQRGRQYSTRPVWRRIQNDGTFPKKERKHPLHRHWGPPDDRPLNDNPWYGW